MIDQTSNFSADEDENAPAIPSYLISANNHSLSNGNVDIFGEPVKRSFANRAYNMVGAGVVSGLNSFYNTAQWAGNWFSDEDVQYRDAKDVIASFDEDMAQYYSENRQSADLLGLVITGLVPGLGGVKVFNGAAKALSAAKSGTIGANMSKGLGILPGSRDALIKQASETFAKSQLPFSYKNKDVVKAITAGFGQNALESLAFETAVAVTMKKNPILTDLSFGETVKNIAVGSALGGAIGGVFSGVGAVSKIKKGMKAVDNILTKAGANQLDQGVAGTRASDELLIIRNDLDTMHRETPEGVSSELFSQVTENKIQKAENRSRELMTKLVEDGDKAVGNALWDGISRDSTAQLGSKLLGLVGISPMNLMAKFSKKFRNVDAPLPEVPKGYMRVWYKEGDNFASTTRQADSTHWYEVIEDAVTTGFPANGGAALQRAQYNHRYLKLWGDDAGKISDELPAARHLADAGKVTVRSNGVEVGKNFLPHKQGRVDMTTLTYDEALARNIWAMDSEVAPLALKKNQTAIEIHPNDTAMLTKAYRENFTAINVIGDNGEILLANPTKENLLKFIARQKDELTQSHLINAIENGIDETVEHIANRYDVTLGFLTGEQFSANLENAVMGLMNAQKQWYNRYHANTLRPPKISDVAPWKMPQNYAMAYDNAATSGLDAFQVDAMATIRARQEVYKTQANNAAAGVLGNKYELLPEISDALLHKIDRAGVGPGMASYSMADLGSPGQIAELVGSLVTRWVGQAADKISSTFTAVNYAIANDPAQAAELFTVLQKVRAAGSSYKYVISEAGDGLILKAARDLPDGEILSLPQHVDEFIPVDSPDVMRWLTVHRDTNGARLEAGNTLRTAQGLPANWDPEVIYAPPPDAARFKNHAFVVDSSRVTGQGDTTMLYADDAVNLERQIEEARAQGFEVYKPSQAEDYYRARGRYEHSMSLSESQFDTSLRASGSSAPAFPLTGTPQEMLQDIMQWHTRLEGNLIRNAVETKYWREFGILRTMGKEYESLANARTGFLNKIQGSDIGNPYTSYVKTALGTSLKSEYPTWGAINDFIEKTGTKVYDAVSQIWRSPGKTYDIEKVNAVFDKYGLKMPATQAQLEAWVDHPAGRKAVSEFIQTQNAVLSSLVLRLDPINALNNAVSSPILTLTEAGSWIRKLPGMTEELAARLDIPVPGTASSTVRSPMKLMAQAVKDFWSTSKPELMNRYRELNVVSDYGQQLQHLMEVATIKGTESAADLAAMRFRLVELGHKLVDKGTTWTGNKLAEEFNRFVSARMADILTEPAVRAGLLDVKTQGAFINTFVNRTQGNIIASQRPQMFQGPLGQAIGLFQSYQFNIMQNLLRYVGEGSKKDAIMLSSLQTAIFGLNGLPAFQAINQHIIGTASGNTNHVDAYTSVNNMVGHGVGQWLMYGAASNMLIDPDLKINLYSRGDISPRQLTIVPSQFSEIPVVAAYSRVYGSLEKAVSSLANGGDVWNTMLSAVEQQGLSRPAAGFARVARAFNNEGVSYSASGQGNIISANELYTFANLARLSGAKPMDEAIAQDAMFRYNAYEARDAAKRRSLGVAIRSVVTGGGTPTEEQMQDFMRSYMQMGGQQEEFIKWYTQQVRAATTPQVNKLINSTKGQASEYMQNIMGGRLMKTPEDVRQELLQRQQMEQ